MESIRVWHLSSNPWNSAITEYAINSVQALKGRGYKNVFSPLIDSPAHFRAQKLGIKVIPFHSFSIKALKQFYCLSKKINPDVIICYEGLEAFLCKLVPGMKKKVCLIRFRGRCLKKREKRYSFFLKLANSHMDQVISPGLALNSEIKKNMTNPPTELVTLGIDTKRYCFNQKRQFTLAEQPRLVVLGRLDPVKGHREFLPIFAEVLKNWPDNQEVKKPILHFVGKPESLDTKSIHQSASLCGLEKNKDYILTPHRVQNTPTLLTNSCIGVIPSLWSEEICRVAEEFLSCGTPVFVSGVGALKDVLFPGAGWCYENLSSIKTAQLLEKATIEAAAETNEKRMARSETAKKLFSIERKGCDLDRLIRNILENKQSVYKLTKDLSQPV